MKNGKYIQRYDLHIFLDENNEIIGIFGDWKNDNILFEKGIIRRWQAY